MATATMTPGNGSKAVVERKTSGLIPQEELKAIIALDETLRDGKREILEAEESGSLMLKGLMTARVTQQVRSLITPAMMRDIMALMNTPIGFKTDHDPMRGWKGPAYSEDVVRDVVIIALLDGARLVGNEFNIIASGYYATKEQLERKVREFPGLTELRYGLSVAQQMSGGALVAGWASWKLNGVADRLDCVNKDGFDGRIPVKTYPNGGDGQDLVHGKATRKLMFRILKRLTGQNFNEAEPGEEETTAEPTIDASYTVQESEPVVSPVWQYEQRFLESASIDAADGVLADVMAEDLDDDSVALAKSWHAEALKRLAAELQTETVVEHDADSSHPLAGVQAKMQAADTKRDIERIYMDASRIQGLSETDAKTLYAWRGQNLQRIHESRGPRSNAKAGATT